MWTIPDALKFEIVRVLGFPDVLSSASIQPGYPNYNSEYAMFQPYAQLMNKLNYLSNAPVEAVRIFGAEHPAFSGFYASASFNLAITTPSSIATGATISLVVNGVAAGNVTAASSETPTSIGTKVATALTASGFVFASNGAGSVTAYATQPGKVGNGITILAISSDPSLLLNGATVSVGATSMGSDPPGEYLSDTSLAQPVWGYLPIIRVLQNDILASRLDLRASVADVVTLRATEIPERDALCNRMRRKLADALAVPLDPDIAGNRRQGRMRVI